jgi:hypothetical protein
MVQMSQTSWQDFSLADVKEILTFAPLNLAIGANPVLHYTLPRELAAGEKIKYTIVAGFKTISWTGIIGAINEGKLMVRLRKTARSAAFTATHWYEAEGSFTACCDEFTFQGFTDIAESEFKDLIDKTHVIYALRSRKAAQEIELAVEAKKQTQSFESLDSSATAGRPMYTSLEQALLDT